MQNTGGLQRLAASPVGSRVVQSCVKHGTPEQRRQILQELQPQMLELSKSPYAYHVVCKLVDTASKADLEGGTCTELLDDCKMCFRTLQVRVNATQLRAAAPMPMMLNYCVIFLIL